MTQEELDTLARFARGKRWWSHESSGQPSEPGWLFEQLRPNWPVIMVKNWHSDTNPAHADLVLRVLREKVNVEICFGTHKGVSGQVVVGLWRKLGDKRISFAHFAIGGNWWPEAVCRAALEVIKGENDE